MRGGERRRRTTAPARPALIGGLGLLLALSTTAGPALGDERVPSEDGPLGVGDTGTVTVLQLDARPGSEDATPVMEGLPASVVGQDGTLVLVDAPDGSRAVVTPAAARAADLGSGDTVRLDAVRALSTGGEAPDGAGEVTSVISTATVLDPAADPASVGTRRVTVFPVYWGAETPPSSPTPAELAGTVEDVGTYLDAATRGQGTAELRDVRPWTRIAMPESASCAVITREVERRVLALGADLPRQPTEHLLAYFPQTERCGWAGLGTIGRHTSGRSLIWMNGLMTSRSWAHEIGHNLGLHHSGVLRCTDGTGREVTLSEDCVQREYDDPWDLMGNHPHGRVGAINAEHQRQLGLLEPGQARTVRESERVVLGPVSQGAGLVGAEVDMGARHLFLEWRAPTGPDSWIEDLRYERPDGTEVAAPGGGLVIRVRDAQAPLRQVLTTLDLRPDGLLDEPTLATPALRPGQWWLSPDATFGARVLSGGDDGATVDVVVPGSDATGGDSARLRGENRYETSVAVSASRFGPGVDRVYLAGGVDHPDALASGPAGTRDGAPVLLSQPNRIPAVVRAELERLAPREIVLVGGATALGRGVAEEAAQHADSVVRWGGDTRFDTAAAVSRNTRAPGVPVVYLASGRDFPDALAAAPAAGAAGGPVLLADTARLPRVIESEIARLRPARVVVLGGPGVVSDGVLEAVAAVPGVGEVQRLPGDDRFDTAARISRARYPDGADVVYVASGRQFADAVSVAPVAGLTPGPVLLADPARVPADTLAEIQRLAPERVVVLGSDAAIGHPPYNRVAMEVD